MAGCRVSPRVPFYVALKSRDISTLHQLISDHGSRLDMDMSFKVGLRIKPALCIAAEHGYDNIVSLLLTHGSSKNQADSTQQTALHLAAYHRHQAVVHLLLAWGADPNRFDEELNSPLHAATLSNSLEIVQALVEHGGNLNHKNRSHTTPLLLACQLGNKEIADYCIENGAVPDIPNEEGLSPLYYAPLCGLSTVEKLVRAGSHISNSPSSPSLLHRAISVTKDTDPASLAILSLLLDAGCDVNHRNRLGQTPLMLALRNTSLQAARLLISTGRCDLNARDLLGMSPLRKACFEKWGEMVRLMVDMGLSITKERWLQEESGGVWCQWLSEVVGEVPQVPALTALCRKEIRSQIKECGKNRNMETLPLPRPLIAFLHLSS